MDLEFNSMFSKELNRGISKNFELIEELVCENPRNENDIIWEIESDEQPIQ